MMSGVFQKWMKDWDITHQPSSAYFPHSNSRAETAVKSSKRMLQDCVSRACSINNDKFMKAILQYRNTPQQDWKDPPGPHSLAKSREVHGEKLARNTKHLKDLPIGSLVAIQNQSGCYPTKWDKTGVVVEVKPHEQIVVKVNGSRRLTLRNRRFVCELDPGKTSLEDQHLMTTNSSAPAFIPRPKKTRQSVSAEASSTRTPSSASSATSPQTSSSESTLPPHSVLVPPQTE